MCLKLAKYIIKKEVKQKKEGNKMQEKSKKSQGITLVALVITIIILLILAGITINALTNSGLLTKAGEVAKISKLKEI